MERTWHIEKLKGDWYDRNIVGEGDERLSTRIDLSRTMSESLDFFFKYNWKSLKVKNACCDLVYDFKRLLWLYCGHFWERIWKLWKIWKEKRGKYDS